MFLHFDIDRFWVRALRKYKFIILLAGCLSFFSTVWGQPFPVKISIAVMPPYPSRINDYISQPNKIMATLINTSSTAREVYLLGQFTDGNYIKIYTDPSFKMSPPVILQPGIPLRLNLDNIGQVFSANHLIFEGISKNDLLYVTGLPEGNYTICLRAYDYETGFPLSPEDPLGCSNTFSVTDVEPPTILQPVCGTNAIVSTPQVLNVLWTRPPGCPADVRYSIQIFDVRPGTRNINDAVSSGILPLFFETTVEVNSYLLGAAAPSLVPGRTYAILITAFSPANLVNFRNHGKSEVCSFKYGDDLIKGQKTNPGINFILPEDGMFLYEGQPISFVWKPALQNPIEEFSIEIFELKPDQFPEDAMKANPPFYKKDGIRASSLRYMITDLNLDKGKRWMWIARSNQKGDTMQGNGGVWVRDGNGSYYWAPGQEPFEIRTLNIRGIGENDIMRLIIIGDSLNFLYKMAEFRKALDILDSSCQYIEKENAYKYWLKKDTSRWGIQFPIRSNLKAEGNVPGEKLIISRGNNDSLSVHWDVDSVFGKMVIYKGKEDSIYFHWDVDSIRSKTQPKSTNSPCSSGKGWGPWIYYGNAWCDYNFFCVFSCQKAWYSKMRRYWNNNPYSSNYQEKTVKVRCKCCP